jgi:hypothetical protein
MKKQYWIYIIIAAGIMAWVYFGKKNASKLAMAVPLGGGDKGTTRAAVVSGNA